MNYVELSRETGLPTRTAKILLQAFPQSSTPSELRQTVASKSRSELLAIPKLGRSALKQIEEILLDGSLRHDQPASDNKPPISITGLPGSLRAFVNSLMIRKDFDSQDQLKDWIVLGGPMRAAQLAAMPGISPQGAEELVGWAIPCYAAKVHERRIEAAREAVARARKMVISAEKRLADLIEGSPQNY